VEGAVKKIAVSGGAAVTICPVDKASRVQGMTWDAGGIVFGWAKGIMRVSANGGQPEVLVSAKDGELVYGPQVLPGGEWVLFTVATAATTDAWDKAQIVVQSLKSSERKTLVSGGSDGRYLPTGHLVYALGGVLFAVPFDLPRLAVTGGPVSIVEGVKRSGRQTANGSPSAPTMARTPSCGSTTCRAPARRADSRWEAAIVCPSGLRTASAWRFSRTAKAISASSGSALTARRRRSA
jgi:serine/threonine-protein kinase